MVLGIASAEKDACGSTDFNSSHSGARFSCLALVARRHDAKLRWQNRSYRVICELRYR